MQPEALRELIEGKFVDVLRSVAAEMTMEQMHEKRGEYVKRVKAAVAEDLLKNGLELESVSLTGLDQTNMEFFNPSNAFDAEGLTRLTEEIERRKKIRNDIEQDTMIQIRNKNLEAEKLSLEIDRDSEYARLAQERELEIRRATQRAEVAREKAGREREAEQAQIEAHEADRAYAHLAASAPSTRSASSASGRSRSWRSSGARRWNWPSRIAPSPLPSARGRNRKRRPRPIRPGPRPCRRRRKCFRRARLEIAERRKAIELIAAAQDAERDGIRVRLTAEADKDAATDRAEARRLDAEGEAEAEKIRVLAARLRYEVEAEGTRQMNEAQNTLTPESRASVMRLRLLEKLEGIIRESVRPMEKIEGIKILQVDGLGGGNGGGRGDGEGRGSIADSVVNSALRYRAQAPLIDSLLREIGLVGGDISKLTQGLDEPERPAPKRERASIEGGE